jgi:hypothetical protein
MECPGESGRYTARQQLAECLTALQFTGRDNTIVCWTTIVQMSACRYRMWRQGKTEQWRSITCACKQQICCGYTQQLLPGVRAKLVQLSKLIRVWAASRSDVTSAPHLHHCSPPVLRIARCSFGSWHVEERNPLSKNWKGTSGNFQLQFGKKVQSSDSPCRVALSPQTCLGSPHSQIVLTLSFWSHI